VSSEGAGVALGASYRLEERLGRGATGEVWRAVDRRTDEVVAAKLLRQEHTSDQDLVGRFIRERSILTGLRHPHVVAVRDLVVEGDRLAIIMDFVDGGSLRDVLTHEGPLPPQRAAAVVAAVLDGLAAAHAQGILHRDLKPDNVLLSRSWRDLDPGAVRLSDFGVSRMVADGRGTTTGLMGTPEYMAPELLVTGTCDLSADVYGAGILLYELLAGRTPFAGPGTDYTIAHRHVASVPPPLPVPEGLARQLEAMLAKDPTARPAAAESAAALRRVVPSLAGVPALEAQAAPSDFDSARGPMTMLRGVTPEPAPPAAHTGDGQPEQVSSPDLGTSDHGTMLRPMAVPSVREQPRREPESPARRKRRPAWRDPRALAVVAASLVLLGGAVAYATTRDAPATDPGPGTSTEPVTATTTGTPLPTGLTVDRQAVYDPASESVQLTITYSAQKAELRGPFLEVIPGTDGGDCPTVTWEGPEQDQNISTSGFDLDCAWSIDPGPVPAPGSAVVTATVPLTFDDPGTEVQEWLQQGTLATDEAINDQAIRTDAYPAQRMQGIEVDAPARLVMGSPVRLTIRPVWPSGVDLLNPLYTSPTRPSATPSSLLTAVAGGEQGVRFSDACSGALAVTGGGLLVSADLPATDCSVNTTVGNFVDVPSEPFSIVGRRS